jgi:hypothetical protein
MCILVATFLALACTLLGSGSHAESGDPDAPRLTSSAFADGGEIPVRYTCDGDNVSPPLAWSNLPEGTRSLALVVDDPDAPDPKKARASSRAPRPETFRAARRRAATAGSERATAARALPSGDTATSTGSTPWTPCFPTSTNRPKAPYPRPWRATC